ncbi:hypothetical protein C8R45DRAFT_943333, partial [Mycena sanguinolenta]
HLKGGSVAQVCKTNCTEALPSMRRCQHLTAYGFLMAAKIQISRTSWLCVFRRYHSPDLADHRYGELQREGGGRRPPTPLVDDKNYRPTERLAVVQDPNGSSSESAFDALDQLYITILSSAPRQSQLIPVLCAIIHLSLAASQIDQLFGLTEGETRLLLRGLHSVLNVPSKETVIFAHHAFFGDFIRNPDRSGSFCVHAGPFQRTNNFLLSHVLRFIVSLPPSGAVAELFPLIGAINPDYIFDSKVHHYPYPYRHNGADLASIVSWFKNSPSAPADLIQLWQDYVFMFFIDTIHLWTQSPSVQHIVSPSAELLRILVSLGLLRHTLSDLPHTLDLTWTDLRTTLCSLRPNVVGNEQVLSVHQPQAAYPKWAARTLALRFIGAMVKNHIDTDGGVNPSASRDAVLLYNVNSSIFDLAEAYKRSQYDLGCGISFLVRLSPPCPVLHRELWHIPPSEIWSSPLNGNRLIRHVSKWLESFPDSTMELITFHRKCADAVAVIWHSLLPDHRYSISTFTFCPDIEERDWCSRVSKYNDMISCFHEPRQLSRILVAACIAPGLSLDPNSEWNSEYIYSLALPGYRSAKMTGRKGGIYHGIYTGKKKGSLMLLPEELAYVLPVDRELLPAPE